MRFFINTSFFAGLLMMVVFKTASFCAVPTIQSVDYLDGKNELVLKFDNLDGYNNQKKVKLFGESDSLEVFSGWLVHESFMQYMFLVIELDDKQADTVESWPNVETSLEVSIEEGVASNTDGSNIAQRSSVTYYPSLEIRKVEYKPESNRLTFVFDRDINDSKLLTAPSIGLSTDNAIQNYLNINEVTWETGDAPNDNLVSIKLSNGQAGQIESWPNYSNALEYSIASNMFESYHSYLIVNDTVSYEDDHLVNVIHEPKGVISRWYFEESGGDIAYPDGKGYDAYLRQQAAFDVEREAVVLYGKGYVSVADNFGLDNLNSMTVSMWIKRDTINKPEVLLSKGTDPISAYQLQITDTNTIHFSVTSDESYSALNHELTSEAMVDSGSWYHIAAVYSPTQIALYMNGKLDRSLPHETFAPGIIDGQDSLLIGTLNKTVCFDGSVGHTAIYNDSFSLDSVAALYEREYPLYRPDIVPPDNVTYLTADTVDTQSVKLTWSINSPSPDTDSMGIWWSKVGYVNTPDVCESECRSLSFGTENSTIVDNLEPGVKYYFSISAKDTAGNWAAIDTEAKTQITVPAYLGPVWYVDAAAGSGGTGKKEDPFNQIQQLKLHVKPGDTVRVAQGRYAMDSCYAQFQKSIVWQGSFDPNFLKRNVDIYPSVILADKALNSSVFELSSGMTHIDGFVFENHTLPAIKIADAGAKITNNRFVECSGAGLKINGFSSRVIDISNNIFAVCETGISIVNAGAVNLINNTFINNHYAVSIDVFEQFSFVNNIVSYGKCGLVETGTMNFGHLRYNSFFALDTLIKSGTSYSNSLDELNSREMSISNKALQPYFWDRLAVPANLHLRKNSPCIDAGDPEMIPSVPNEGGVVNLGAYGNTEFATITDKDAPNNTFQLKAVAVDLDKVELSWDSQEGFPSDAESVGIWYSSGEAPTDPNTTDAVNHGYFPLNHYPITISGLTQNTWYFALALRDSAHNISSFVSTSIDTVRTPSMFTGIDHDIIAVSHAAIAWGDCDNDDDPDLFISGKTSDGIGAKLYINTGGVLTASDASFTPVYDGAAKWGDYDNDGDLDLAVCGMTDNGAIAAVYRNDGGEKFTDAGFNIKPLHSGDISWVDYDNDGDLDLVISGLDQELDSRTTLIYQNRDNYLTNASGLEGLSGGNLSWADFDNDGDADLLYNGFDGSFYRSLIYSNKNGYLEVFAAELPGVSGKARWLDFDCDGDQDILLFGNDSDGRLVKLFVNSSGQFTEIETNLPALSSADAAWGDFDNDGVGDLVMVGQSDNGAFGGVFVNKSRGFELSPDHIPALKNVSCEPVDYDKDGDLDLLISGSVDMKPVTYLYRNNASIKNTAPNYPQNLKTSTFSDSSVKLSWEPASDNETSQQLLSYNVYLGTDNKKESKVSGHANPGNGYLKTVTMGNAFRNTSKTIVDMPEGKYTWSVQAIDQGYAGSVFAESKTFVIDRSAPDNDMTLKVDTNNPDLTALSWNPSAIDSADADSVGIWYSTDSYPQKVFDGISNEVGCFPLTDSSASLPALPEGHIYFFSLFVRDSSGNWSTNAVRYEVDLRNDPAPVTNRNIWYVNSSAGIDGDGSLSAPFDSLHKVFGMLDKGDTVLIAKGTYVCDLSAEKPLDEVLIQGGYDSSFADNDPYIYRTVIDGKSIKTHFMTLQKGCVIDGITFKNIQTVCLSAGYASNIRISRCVFKNCANAVRIENCDTVSIINNIIEGTGTGIRCISDKPSLIRIENNTLVKNIHYGIKMSGTLPNVRNTIFADNGIAFYQGTGQNPGFLFNCFFGNGAILKDSTSGQTISNVEEINDWNESRKNIQLSPTFLDSTFRLASNSPCIDAGDSSSNYNEEPEAASNGCINIGAYGNTPYAALKSSAAELVNTANIELALKEDSIITCAFSFSSTSNENVESVAIGLSRGKPEENTAYFEPIAKTETFQQIVFESGRWYVSYFCIDTEKNFSDIRVDSIDVPNSAPVLSVPVRDTVLFSAEISYSVDVFDRNGDPLVVAAEVKPSLSWRVEGTNISWKTDMATDLCTLSVKLSDNHNAFDSATVLVYLNKDNHAPVIDSVITVDTVLSEDLYECLIYVTDRDLNQTIGAEISNAPWLDVIVKPRENNQWMLRVAGTPGNDLAGDIKYSVKCFDSQNGYFVKEFILHVINENVAPETKLTMKHFNPNWGAIEYEFSDGRITDEKLSFMGILKGDGRISADTIMSNSGRYRWFPLMDGTYTFTCAAIRDGKIDQSPFRDTFTVTGATRHVFADTGEWDMISVPACRMDAGSFFEAGHLVRWNEKREKDDIYKYYERKDDIKEMKSGEGYWFNGKLPVTIDVGDIEPVKDSCAVYLSHKDYGWNQISSPYPFPVKWPGSSIVWRWNSELGDYLENDNILYPWEAYWVRTDKADTVVLKPEPILQPEPLAKKAKTFFAGRDDWRIQLKLSSDKYTDNSNYIGFDPRAKNGKDAMDQPEPPRMAKYPCLFINRPDWNSSFPRYAGDIRRVLKDNEIEVFQLGFLSGEQTNGTMKFSVRGVSQLQNVYLFYGDRSEFKQITADTTFTVSRSNETVYKTIFVSSDAGFVRKIPMQFGLGLPYPNPARPTVFLKYQLPYRWHTDGRLNSDNYFVTMKIYDMRGRVVRQLVHRPQQPGYHQTFWDGKSNTGRLVAAGTYFCQLDAGEYKGLRRITLLR